jgi:ADP-heptose:LPS heptosyltransferase
MKLLIIKPSSLGDIVHALVVIESIKSQRPDSEITWVARGTFAPILESAACVDRIIVFDRKAGLGGFIRLLKEIRRERYDAVLEMQGLLRTGLMAWAARSPLKIGRRDTREGASFFVHKRVRLPQKSQHAVDKLMEFLPALGLAIPAKTETLSLKPDISAPKLPEGSILIFPSARGKKYQKEWPFFKELTVELLKKHPVAWCGDLPMDVPVGALDYCGKVSLKELLPFIKQARLIVSNDSGPMHMASAMGVEVLGIFGPTDPAKVGPYPLQRPNNHIMKSSTGRIEDLPAQEVLRQINAILV